MNAERLNAEVFLRFQSQSREAAGTQEERQAVWDKAWSLLEQFPPRDVSHRVLSTPDLVEDVPSAGRLDFRITGILEDEVTNPEVTISVEGRDRYVQFFHLNMNPNAVGSPSGEMDGKIGMASRIVDFMEEKLTTPYKSY